MSTIKDGGPAFPNWPLNHYTDQRPHGGMSLRDAFAFAALPCVYTTAMAEAAEGSGLFSYPEWRDGLALDAYLMADAMLRAREQS